MDTTQQKLEDYGVKVLNILNTDKMFVDILNAYTLNYEHIMLTELLLSSQIMSCFKNKQSPEEAAAEISMTVFEAAHYSQGHRQAERTH